MNDKYLVCFWQPCKVSENLLTQVLGSHLILFASKDYLLSKTKH